MFESEFTQPVLRLLAYLCGACIFLCYPVFFTLDRAGRPRPALPPPFLAAIRPDHCWSVIPMQLAIHPPFLIPVWKHNRRAIFAVRDSVLTAPQYDPAWG